MTLYINGQAVEAGRIEREIERMRPSYERAFADQPDDQRQRQLAEWACENVIEAVLFAQAAQREFPTIAEADIEAFLAQFMEQEGPDGIIHQRLSAGAAERQKLYQEAAEQIRTDRLVQKITAGIPAPKDKDIRRYYQQHIERFSVPEMVRAAHIVKHPSPDSDPQQQREQMEALLTQIRGGADFAAIAAEHSACPERGGDLGYFPRGQMVEPFEDVVFHLSPGQVSDVFATEFGWHIAKVLDKKPAAPCPLEQVRPAIVSELTAQARDKAIEQFLDAQRQAAIIEERGD